MARPPRGEISPATAETQGGLDVTGLTPLGENSPAPRPGLAPTPNPVPGEDMGEEANVTEQEQAQFDEFVDKVRSAVFDKKSIQSVLQSLTATDDPVNNLANTAAMAVMTTEDSANQSGINIPPEILMYGGAEVIADLAETAEAAGTHTYTEDEVIGAIIGAMEIYRDMRTAEGRFDPASVQGDMQLIQQADAAGKMGEVIPQFDKIAAKFGGTSTAANPATALPGEETPPRNPNRKGLMPG